MLKAVNMSRAIFAEQLVLYEQSKDDAKKKGYEVGYGDGDGKHCQIL